MKDFQSCDEKHQVGLKRYKSNGVGDIPSLGKESLSQSSCFTRPPFIFPQSCSLKLGFVINQTDPQYSPKRIDFQYSSTFFLPLFLPLFSLYRRGIDETTESIGIRHIPNLGMPLAPLLLLRFTPSPLPLPPL